MSGADLLTETPTGYTGMHFAALHGHVHCMKVGELNYNNSLIPRKGSERAYEL